MKTKIFLFFALLLLSCTYANSTEAESGNNFVPEGSINVFTTPDLYPLTMQWANEYNNQNPKITIHVTGATENSVAERIKSGNEIGFLSPESYPKQIQSVWNVVVGRDLIVLVMNSKNPMLAEIYQKGISPSKLASILQNPGNQNWGSLLGNSQNIPLHFLLANDLSIQSGMVDFLAVNQSELNGIQSVSASEMISEIQNDPYAIGFCKLIQVTDLKNQSLATDLTLVPIDINGNGKIDVMENIYENLQTFSRGVWIGKYPKTLSSKIYLVTNEKLTNPNEIAFLKWVLTEGQQFLGSNGYSDLIYAERQTQLAKFDEPVLYANIPREKTNTFMAVMLAILVVIVASGIILDVIFRRISNRKMTRTKVSGNSVLAFDEESVNIPGGLYFDKTHTWAFRRKNGTVKVGIDDFIQHITGSITRIEMKNAGDRIKKGDLLFSIIRKGKLLNIYSPISGIIKENNKNLSSDSSLFNSAPYAEGWVYVIEPANWELEIQYLFLAEKYKSWLNGEFRRLKDFFATVFKPHSLEFAHAVLQDGGALKDNVLADLGPEVWEDFQTKFIDTSK